MPALAQALPAPSAAEQRDAQRQAEAGTVRVEWQGAPHVVS